MMRVESARLEIATDRALAFVDLTGELEAFIAGSGITDGLLQVASPHTTCAVIVNEHEPSLLADLARWLEEMAPAGRGWRHDALARTIPGEPENTHAHLRALLLGGSTTLAVRRGRLSLGTWQSVILVELDGPRRRRVELTLIGSGGGRDG